jgi:hypothetical protein
MFGVLPAYGLYIRHADGVSMRNVRAKVERSDSRPALVFDDVKDLNLDGFSGDGVAGQPLVWMNATRDAFVPRKRPSRGSFFALDRRQ